MNLILLVQTGQVKANLVTFYFWILCFAQESQDKSNSMQYGDFACSIVCTRWYDDEKFDRFLPQSWTELSDVGCDKIQNTINMFRSHLQHSVLHLTIAETIWIKTLSIQKFIIDSHKKNKNLNCKTNWFE